MKRVFVHNLVRALKNICSRSIQNNERIDSQFPPMLAPIKLQRDDALPPQQLVAPTGAPCGVAGGIVDSVLTSFRFCTSLRVWYRYVCCM